MSINVILTSFVDLVETLIVLKNIVKAVQLSN